MVVPRLRINTARRCNAMSMFGSLARRHACLTGCRAAVTTCLELTPYPNFSNDLSLQNEIFLTTREALTQLLHSRPDISMSCEMQAFVLTLRLAVWILLVTSIVKMLLNTRNSLGTNFALARLFSPAMRGLGALSLQLEDLPGHSARFGRHPSVASSHQTAKACPPSLADVPFCP